MKHRLRPKLTYSNVIATIALFVALGGVATAATTLPRNSVGSKQLQNGSVNLRKLRNGAVNAKKLRKNAVRKNKIAPKAVTLGKLGPRAVAPWNLGNGAVRTNKIANLAIRARNIHNNVITTNKLNNNAVTQQKLAPDSVGAGNVQAGAVGPANIRANSVGTATLQNGSVTAAKLGNDVGPVLGTLKSGQTLRGVFSQDLNNDRSSQSYQFPLAAAPSAPPVNVIPEGGPFTEACKGLGSDGETPQATAGNLCVYVTAAKALVELEPDAAASNRLGFTLTSTYSEEGGFVSGQWAVTAP